MSHDDDTATCSKCGAEIDALAVFPGGICVSCYAETPAANAPLASADVAGMWGKENLS